MFFNGVNRGVDKKRLVPDDIHREISRQVRRTPGEVIFDQIHNLDRVGARLFANQKSHGVLAVQSRKCFNRFLDVVFDVA